jgi:hypothetical protein
MGTLETSPTSPYWYYTGGSELGTDTFTWKVNDGADDSNIATFTVNVTGSPPVVYAQTACVEKNTTADIPVSFTGGAGYTLTPQIRTAPTQGTAVVSGLNLQYTPDTDFEGTDSIKWRMKYENDVEGVQYTGDVICTVLVKTGGANDWPTWRGDSHRSNATLNSVPGTLHLQWRRDYPALTAAWNREARVYEAGYEPVVMGKKIFAFRPADMTTSSRSTRIPARLSGRSTRTGRSAPPPTLTTAGCTFPRTTARCTAWTRLTAPSSGRRPPDRRAGRYSATSV